MKLKECPECGSNNIFIKEGTNSLICRDCGAIVEENIPKK